MRGWIGRHRALTAFVGGACLTLIALAVAGYWVLSDQRRSARVLAAALSQSLAREVRIDRVTDLTPDRVVMTGVALPGGGGWPATIVAERVEATGPLLAAARGDAAPVRVTVVRPTIEMPAGTGGGDLAAALAGLRDAVRGLVTNPALLDVALTGGRVRGAGKGAEFELTLQKGVKEAKGTLAVHDAAGPPLTLAVEARLDGDTARLAVAGRGPLAPIASWLPPAVAAALRERALDLRVDADLGQADALARLRLAVGEALGGAGTVALKAGVLEVTLPRATVDLDLLAAAAGLGWQPTGRAEFSDLTATWKSDGGRLPTMRAAVRVPVLGLPASGVGADIAIERLEATAALDPATAQPAIAGEARAARLRTPRLDGAPVEIKYQVALDDQGRVSRVELASLRAGAEGARLQGTARFDVKAGLLDARLEGDDVEAEGLVRRLLPGWLEPADLLRVSGLRLTATGLEPATLQRGSTRLEARGFRLTRPNGQLAGGRLSAHSEFAAGGAKTEVAAERVASTLAMLPGEFPRLGGTVELARGADGFRPDRAALTARDARGAEMLVATLAPGDRPDRFRLSAQAPALERLGGLWPDVSRKLNGTARLDVELSDGFGAADGRLVLAVPEGELSEGKISLRDLQVDLPIRRGLEAAGEPRWGTLGVGELIAYGVVVHDVATPARVWRDRLALSKLAYVLYSGSGEGWSEVAFESAGLAARGKLTGGRVRIEEFMSAYGVRGGTMTGLLKYEVDYQYRDGRLGLNGRFEVPEGGTVNIQLLDRILGHAEADPTGVVRRALENLRAFDYKDASAEVRSAGDDIRISLGLRGRERFLVFPPRVREINVRDMPLSFLARQFPGT